MRTAVIAAVTATVVVALYALFLAPRPSEPDAARSVSTEYADLSRRVQELERGLAALQDRAPARLEGAADAAQQARIEALEARLEPLRALEARLETLEEAARAKKKPPAPADPGSTQEEVDKWLARLRDPNENIAFAATLELGRLKDPRAVPALIGTLQTHRDFYVRLGAAAALGDIRTFDAVPPLIEALMDEDALVSTAANDALCKITEHGLPFKPDAPERERLRAQDVWRQWWQDNEARLRAR